MQGISIASRTEQIPNIRPYFDIDDRSLKTLAELFASGQVTNNGIYVRDFERKLGDYLGVKHAVAVSNGADALLLALKASVIAPGKVVLPAYTYIATLNAVVHAGLSPVFCDIDEHTFTMDPQCLSQIIQTHENVRCVVPVNVFGVPADLLAIRKLCDRAKACLVYDNAHGFGTTVNGRRISSAPDAQIFSFHATKTLPAVEGGLVLSSDPKIIESVRQLRNHGLAPNLEDSVPGFNAKMDEIRAIVGIQSLEKFADTLERRRYYGHRLTACRDRFPDTFVTQAIPDGVETNFQNLGVRCPAALETGLERVMHLFQSLGVGVRSYFNPPLHKLKGFKSKNRLPVTESVWQTLISFPIHSRMTEPALDQIENAICKVAEALRADGLKSV
jgi:dTDP-4-amino-4,6-dideoxygalactose transaminase